MKYAVYTGCFGPFADARVLAEMARDAEEAGWDGFFVSDHLLWTQPENFQVIDPWIALGCIATATSRIKIGPMVTPIPRRRPAKLAREIITLDRLSEGRLVLGVGSGHDIFREYGAFGEAADRTVLGEKLDEGLEVLMGLLSGRPYSYEGKHYRVDNVQYLPPPAQTHIPVWVAGMWPNKKPFSRAARWDGAFPIGRDNLLTPEDIRLAVQYLSEQAPPGKAIEVVHNGPPLIGNPAAQEIAAAFEQAGVTWWLEWFDRWYRFTFEELRENVRKGPPVA
jgi:Luciferase-like monooxygenase